MAWWERFRPGRAGGKTSSLDVLRELFTARTRAGANVTLDTAVRVATVLACARVIAEGIAQVPLKLYRESSDGRSRQPAKDHPLYDVLHRRPNPWQTSFAYRETVAMHAVLAGNHYSFKNVQGGRVVELIPFRPNQVTVKRNPDDDYDVRYVVRSDQGKTLEFPSEAIWHVRGPSWDSWSGLEIVKLAREAIGLSMAIEEQQAAFYLNGASTSGLLSVEGTLTEDQYKKLRDWLDKEHVGSRNSGRPMIVDRSAKWIAQAMSSADAQTLEQRGAQIDEVCRFFRVMPIMVGRADKTATYASAEQMFLAHVVHTLSPWYERLEQAIDCDLLTDEDRRAGLYAKFVEEGLLRGALRDTADYLVKLSAGGIMTRNEARSKLDLNPLDGLDEPLTPVNTVAGDPPRVDPSPDPAPSPTPGAP